MTPGRYIQLRRVKAGLSIAQVEALLAGGGVLSAPLAMIEADWAVPTGMDAALLNWVCGVDDLTIARLKAGEPVQVCSRCGCSYGYECEDQHLGRCTLEIGRATCTGCELQTKVEQRMAVMA